jgi:hypothetical protein
MTAQDMRFGIIREKSLNISETFSLDGKYCNVCHLPTEIGNDKTRRYCTNNKCNALIID